MASLDRRSQILEDMAIKAPVRVATTANITLSGAQTIDGVSVVADDRVLVKDQTAPTENGIYVCSSGNWTRATDANSNTDFVFGTLVLVTSGTVSAGLVYVQTCTDSTITIDTSEIAFTEQTQNATARQIATSSSSVAIGTGAKSFTTQAGKDFEVPDYLLIYSAADPEDKMLGKVTSYSGTALDVTVVAIGGSGTNADWVIVLTNSSASAGRVPPVGTGDVTGPSSSTDSFPALYDGTTGKLLKQHTAALGSLAVLSSVTAQYLATSAIAQGVGMLNGTLALSVGSNALTIALKTLAGTDPSASDPVYFLIRTTSGGYAVRTVSAATSLVISNGSNLGATVNSTPFRVWIVAFDDGGTIRLGAINCSTIASGISTIYPLDEWNTRSSTAEGGAGGADSAGVIYTGSAVTTKNFTILGFADWDSGLASAGVWAAGPTRVVLNAPGVPKPGQRVQRVRNQTGAMTTGTTTVPVDDSIPQNNEGNEVLTQVITPSSKQNILLIESLINLAVSAAGGGAIALFQDSTANALAAMGIRLAETGAQYHPMVKHAMLANTLSATTFKIRGGNANAATVTFNGIAGARIFALAGASYLEIEEIMG